MSSAPPVEKKAPLTPAERRRRKQRRAWIPTIVIGAVILVAVVTAISLNAAGVFRVTKPVAGDSKFNIAGIKVIDGAADVQIDVRKPLSTAKVGLPADSKKTFGPFNGVELQVDLVGKTGIQSIFVDSMRVTTGNGFVTSLATTTTGSGFSFIHNQLESMTGLGLTTAQMARFEDAMPNGAGGPSSHFSLPFGTGNALGVPTTVDVRCAGANGCTVTTKTTLLTP